MLEELQAAWGRPGEIIFRVYDKETLNYHTHELGWDLSWKITRPVKMWFGKEKINQYGSTVYCHERLARAMVFEALELHRELFDRTMALLDKPIWKRLLWRLRRWYRSRGWWCNWGHTAL